MSNGAGSIQAMITSLKNNKRDRKKITFFNGLVAAKHSKRKLYHKKISKQELQKIISKIDKEARQENRKQNTILLVVFALLIVGTYFLIRNYDSILNLF